MKKNYFSPYKIISFSFLLFILSCALSPDTNAQVVVEKQLGAGWAESGRGLAICADKGYMIAGISASYSAAHDSDVIVMKLDVNGKWLWNKTYGGPKEEEVWGMEKTNDGNFVIIGATKSFGAGGDDFYALKIDQKGDTIWTRTYGGPGTDIGRQIIPTSDGGYIMAGVSNSPGTHGQMDALIIKIDGDGKEQWKYWYGGAKYESGYSIVQLNDGSYVFTGQTFTKDPGGDVYLVKLSSDGTVIWEKNYGGKAEEEGQHIEITPEGGFIIVCDTESFGEGDFDVYVIKVDAAGAVIWSRSYGGKNKDVAKMVQVCKDGNYVVAAISRSFGWKNPNFWILKIEPTKGDTMWTRAYGGPYHEHAYSIRETDDGAYAVVGHTIEDIYFVKFKAGAVGINENEEIQNIVLGPNPTSSKLTIQLESNTETEVSLFDSFSRKVLHEKYYSNSSKDFDLSNLAKGVYFLKVTSNDRRATRKIVLQ